MEIWMSSHLKPSSLGEGAFATSAPVHSTLSHFFSLLFFFFDVVTPNLMLPWQTNERPVHVWQLISLAGGKQLDTANGRLAEEWHEKHETKLYMWSGGFVWKHFKNNTLCCGDSFQAASFYYGSEQWGRQRWPWCGARPLLFNLSSTPWRPPPSQLLSLHILLHLLPYSSDSHQSSSAAAVCIKKRGGCHC